MKPNKVGDERAMQTETEDKPLKKAPKKGMKRVMKERITKDEKGYTNVEEYSSYEEYTPEELEAQQKKKAPGAKVQMAP